ncbi:hypothetical protein J6590_003687 [Homalodisca vitripennis]|nr:hypothetical protein J6590_003687 [Homalodisca vitripennis]
MSEIDIDIDGCGCRPMACITGGQRRVMVIAIRCDSQLRLERTFKVRREDCGYKTNHNLNDDNQVNSDLWSQGAMRLRGGRAIWIENLNLDLTGRTWR